MIEYDNKALHLPFDSRLDCQLMMPSQGPRGQPDFQTRHKAQKLSSMQLHRPVIISSQNQQLMSVTDLQLSLKISI